MMEKTLTVKILSAEETLFEGQATAVFLPGERSPFEVLPGHAPIISTLDPGPVRVMSGCEELVCREIRTGVVRVMDGVVTVCVEI